MKNSVLSILLARWRQLLGFALLFRVLESLLFAPMAALAGKLLLARTVLDSTAVVSFLLSPRGLLALTTAAVTALSIRLVEHAGLAAIFYGAFEDRKIRAREALWLVWRQLLPLVRVSARFVGLSFLVALPLLVMVGGIAAWLLPKHDVNYYLKLRPPEFVTAAVIIGIAATGTAAVLLSLIARWRWVVQVVLFQKKTAGEAFRESSVLTRGLRWKILAVMIGVVLVALALGVIASLAGSVCASAMLAVAGHGAASLAITFGLLLLLQTVFSTACTFFGSCLDAGVFTSLYRRRLMSRGTEASLSDAGMLRQGHPSGWLPIALIVGAVFCAASGTWSALNTLQDEQPISIHAHRGVTARAPENTLAAAREAIAARADYLEIDVQLSEDDVLVVTHDNDFSRLGGVAKKVWDLS